MPNPAPDRALSSTTLSGYVDTSAQWNIGKGDANAPAYGFGGAGKADGFNLNVVDLNLEKDPDAADSWGAGYRAELWMGPDAVAFHTQTGAISDFAVKNAYVDLKVPVGNGLDAKLGVWDTPSVMKSPIPRTIRTSPVPTALPWNPPRTPGRC